MRLYQLSTVITQTHVTAYVAPELLAYGRTSYISGRMPRTLGGCVTVVKRGDATATYVRGVTAAADELSVRGAGQSVDITTVEMYQRAEGKSPRDLSRSALRAKIR